MEMDTYQMYVIDSLRKASKRLMDGKVKRDFLRFLLQGRSLEVLLDDRPDSIVCGWIGGIIIPSERCGVLSCSFMLYRNANLTEVDDWLGGMSDGYGPIGVDMLLEGLLDGSFRIIQTGDDRNGELSRVWKMKDVRFVRLVSRWWSPVAYCCSLVVCMLVGVWGILFALCGSAVMVMWLFGKMVSGYERIVWNEDSLDRKTDGMMDV